MLVSQSAVPQNKQTLADIRQELSILYVEFQQLKRELSTTSGPAVTLTGSTVLDRINAIETEMQRLIAQAEQLHFRIERIVKDGTNRIGDLEFRLVELEGGDISQLGETTTLGDILVSDISEPNKTGETMQLAVGEQADYDAAIAAIEAKDYPKAIQLLDDFNQTYPGSPLAAEVSFRQGNLFNEMNDTRSAAKSFLESYELSSDGPFAADAVLALGIALGELGNVQEACIMLGELPTSFPLSAASASAQEQKEILGCR